MSARFTSPLESLAANLLDAITDLIAGKASTLRDGTEHASVNLPRDLYAHNDVQTEWWYYTGHMKTVSGRDFGFELVFFKRRTDLDRFGLVPLRLLGNPLHLAHFAITDISRGRFRYEHRKSAGGVFDPPATASLERYYLKLGNWSVRQTGGLHLLRATLGSDLIFEAALEPQKPVVLHGQRGVSFKDHGEASRYFSYTRMAAAGSITWHGATERFAGTAWMDREFGTWRTTDNQKGWDWFSLQLSNGADLMVYHIRDVWGNPSPFSSGTFVDAAGHPTRLARADFILRPTGRWQSPRTRAVYPSGWRLQVPRLDIDLSIQPALRAQELDTRGTSMIVYWEGACHVRGQHAGADVDGRAYVELVGYDRSHENPSLASFLFNGALEQGWRSIFGRART
jgi:predicted secreted hydrolase